MTMIKFVQDAVLRKIPIYFKMGPLLFLILILVIPIGIIDDLVGERQMRQPRYRLVRPGAGARGWGLAVS